jgi:hypothetical protein
MMGADPYAARRYQVLKLETHLHTTFFGHAVVLGVTRVPE